MKKIAAIASALALASTMAVANQGGFTGAGSASSATQKGGYTGPKNTQVMTIAQAKQMRDDTKVVLRGNIIKQLGHEKYIFKDATGEITIEIDDDDWGGLAVGANDLVEIYGEVDKDWNSVEIDVDSIRKAQ